MSNLSATSGYGYLTTRDGTQLSVQVVLPGPPDKGPYPAVMEYSGYDPSSPSTGQPQYKLMLPPNGYAWVGVNIRGTGCSGGAFNFFENLQALDGYDAIETIAAQPWSNGHVGMAGISYAGISQLFVARTQPPHLDAITPLSVIDDTWRGILYPGGILNNGFAVNYAAERLEQNKWPNPNAPGWVKNRIAGGDAVCADNMLLRGQNVDLLDQITKHPNPSTALDPEFTYDFPDGSDSLAPAEFARSIKAKVFIAGAWQDEQTGGHWANMINQFSSSALVRAEGQNGVHTESLDPQIAFDALEFLDLYVGHRTPTVSPGVRVVRAAAVVRDHRHQRPAAAARPLHRQDLRRRRSPLYHAEPKVKILWETGNAAGAAPGTLLARAQTAVLGVADPRGASPPPGTCVRTAACAPSRGDRRRAAATTSGRTRRPDPAPTSPSGNIWGATPNYDWRPVADGASLVLRHEAADADDDDGRHRQRRPLDLVERDRQRRAGHADRGACPTAPSATCRTAGSGSATASSTDRRSTTLNPFHSDEVAGHAAAHPGQAHRGAHRAVPVRPPVPRREPDPADASRRPAATGRSGRSTRRRRAAR